MTVFTWHALLTVFAPFLLSAGCIGNEARRVLAASLRKHMNGTNRVRRWRKTFLERLLSQAALWVGKYSKSSQRPEQWLGPSSSGLLHKVCRAP